MENHFEYVKNKLKEIEEFAKDLQKSEWWDEYYDQVKEKLDEVIEYANENKVMLIIDVEDIIEKHYEGNKYQEESSEYEEESSSW